MADGFNNKRNAIEETYITFKVGNNRFRNKVTRYNVSN